LLKCELHQEKLKFAPQNLSRDELTAFTPEWKGKRFEDSRLRAPDDLIERMVDVTLVQT
jgi:hypothetical protein